MKTIKNQFAVIVGITLVLGLARVGARAQDTNGIGGDVGGSVVVPKPKFERPERPARPDKHDNKPGKGVVDSGELKEIVRNFQDQKNNSCASKRNNSAKTAAKCVKN